MTEKQKLKERLIDAFVEHGTLQGFAPIEHPYCNCCPDCYCPTKHNERLAIIEKVLGD